jgi:hypothetical protein
MAGEAHFRKTPWGLAIAEPKAFYLLLQRSGATRDRKKPIKPLDEPIRITER